MKKQPSLEFSGSVSGVSGSIPMNGVATRVPISRRPIFEGFIGSGTDVTSAPDACTDNWSGTDHRVQCTTLKGHLSSATSAADSGSKSASLSCNIGGGSMTRRSRSP